MAEVSRIASVQDCFWVPKESKNNNNETTVRFGNRAKLEIFNNAPDDSLVEVFIYKQDYINQVSYLLQHIKDIEKKSARGTDIKIVDLQSYLTNIDRAFGDNDSIRYNLSIKGNEHIGFSEVSKFNARHYIIYGVSECTLTNNNGINEFRLNLTEPFRIDTPHSNSLNNNLVENSLLYDSSNFCDLNYISAIRTKSFLILGGFSGTGKSQKVKELAYSTCPCDGVLNVSATSPGNYQLIPVKPNWHDATELTGFYSSVNRNYYVTDFMRFLVKAKQYESQKIPFFVCLDEMNLAPVEEYFADFLSIIESRKRLDDGRIVTDALVPASVFNDTSYADDFNIFMSLGLKTVNEEASVTDVNAQVKVGESEIFDRQDIVDDLKANGLTLPQNVVVIGTVNMDDTTNSFSRKVIDRAMTFETLVTRFDETDYFEKQPLLGYVETPIPGLMILPDEVNANQMIFENRFDLSPEDKISIIGFINDVNSDLEGTPFKISYRIINETILLYRAKQKINEDFGQTEAVSLNQVFDDILMQKVLPRIEGDYDKCNACLTKLSSRAAENSWNKSYEKLEFMISRFGKDHCGFTSFWN